MLRTTGTILVVIGFIMLAGAWAITDPFVNDANIGAGGLVLLGRPIGAIGVLLLIIHTALRISRRRPKANSEHP